MKILSFFNHKGGVSKTTTCFNLGWMLAKQGKKTLIVDADPQCNLTALVLDYNSIDDIDQLYSEEPNCDIASCLKPLMSGEPYDFSRARPLGTANDNLFLFCGNLQMAEFETQMSVALTTSRSLPAMKNIPGGVNSLLRTIGARDNYDYILIDMSPSVGALNECLLMSSDYFIVPTTPDFFCAQAIRSLSNVMVRWNAEVSQFRDTSLSCKFNMMPPKFIGFISQRYRPRNGMPAKSFQKWIDIIESSVRSHLIPALSANQMAIDIRDFSISTGISDYYNLANISDFNSLIAQSQKHRVPVFALTDAQIEQGGVILENMQASRDEFERSFFVLAQNIQSLTR